MAISKIILNGVTQMDVTGDTVAAANLISPNTAHGADGEPVTGTAIEKTLTTKSITANGTYNASSDNADGYSTVTVNVSGGGGGGLTLIQTTSLGSLSTSSTSDTDTGKTVSLAQATGWQSYDLLLLDISVDTQTNGRHTSTVTPIFLTASSNVSTKNTYTVVSNKWNSKLSSSGTATTRQGTTVYGIYSTAATASNNTLTLTVHYKYNSTSTGTINGNYTARVYGINLIDLIGG